MQGDQGGEGRQGSGKDRDGGYETQGFQREVTPLQIYEDKDHEYARLRKRKTSSRLKEPRISPGIELTTKPLSTGTFALLSEEGGLTSEYLAATVVETPEDPDETQPVVADKV
jgi:hypothetical protein